MLLSSLRTYVLAISILFLISAPVYGDPISGSVLQCANYLPPDTSISFSISGSIDTAANEPQVSGEITVSDSLSVDSPPPWQEELQLFVSCLKSLVGKADGSI